MWNVYHNGQILIRKAHLSLRLRWAKNDFWKNVIKALIKVKKTSEHVSDFLQLDIRNCVDFKKWSFYTKWVEKGVKTVNDLVLEKVALNFKWNIRNAGHQEFLDTFHVICKRRTASVEKDIIAFKEGY